MVVVLVRFTTVQWSPRSVHFAAYLLSMVLGGIWLLQGLRNPETMLRTPEAPGWGVYTHHQDAGKPAIMIEWNT